jgi:hypothetical protein
MAKPKNKLEHKEQTAKELQEASQAGLRSAFEWI